MGRSAYYVRLPRQFDELAKIDTLMIYVWELAALDDAHPHGLLEMLTRACFRAKRTAADPVADSKCQ